MEMDSRRSLHFSPKGLDVDPPGWHGLSVVISLLCLSVWPFLAYGFLPHSHLLIHRSSCSTSHLICIPLSHIIDLTT